MNPFDRLGEHIFSKGLVTNHQLPWEPKTFILRGYNPYIGGLKPSFFMVLGSKGRLFLGGCWCFVRIYEKFPWDENPPFLFFPSIWENISVWNFCSRHRRSKSKVGKMRDFTPVDLTNHPSWITCSSLISIMASLLAFTESTIAVFGPDPMHNGQVVKPTWMSREGS